MDDQQSINRSGLFIGTSFYFNRNARFVSQNIRDLGSKFQIKMMKQTNAPVPCQEGFAFEYLDAMDQQLHLGGKVQVDVLGVNGKNSPDIQIRDRLSGRVMQEQQLKRSAGLADNAAKSGTYGKQEIRTPKQQLNLPKTRRFRSPMFPLDKFRTGQSVHSKQFENIKLRVRSQKLVMLLLQAQLQGA